MQKFNTCMASFSRVKPFTIYHSVDIKPFPILLWPVCNRISIPRSPVEITLSSLLLWRIHQWVLLYISWLIMTLQWVMILLGIATVMSQWVMTLLCVHIMASHCIITLPWVSFIIYYYAQLSYYNKNRWMTDHSVDIKWIGFVMDISLIQWTLEIWNIPIQKQFMLFEQNDHSLTVTNYCSNTLLCQHLDTIDLNSLSKPLYNITIHYCYTYIITLLNHLSYLTHPFFGQCAHKYAYRF